MPVERRGRSPTLGVSQLATGGAPILDGRRQPSFGGTSRMTRECQVRICERLGVKLPGPTRQQRKKHVFGWLYNAADHDRTLWVLVHVVAEERDHHISSALQGEARQTNCRSSSSESEFMEDALHGCLDGIVV